MKKIIATTLLLTSLFATAASAQYNPEYAQKYKVLNGGAMDHFKSVVRIDCNNGETPDWRITQYDGAFIDCSQRTYERAYEKAGIRLSDKPENVHIAEFLKVSVAKQQGLKTIKKYNREMIDIDDKDLTVQKLVKLANTLSILVSE